MKKILGSPIGLGEVNLTVDKRVRRNIKEYFGDVDNNSFEVKIVKTGVSEEGKLQIKIVVSAPEKHLRKIFLLEENDVKIHFRPITKVENKLETEQFTIPETPEWVKLSLVMSNTMNARLPTTKEEITDANTWETSVISEATRTETKEDSQQTDDTVDDTVDEMNETACNKEQCTIWDETNKVCNSNIKKCEETHPLAICCVTDDCKGQKRIQWREGNVILSIVFICVILIAMFFALRYVIKSYYKNYKDNASAMFEHLWPYKLITIFALLPCPVGILYFIMVIAQTINGTLQPKFITCEDEIAKEKCESDVTKKWKNATKACVDKCENGKICTGDKCICDCPKGETYRTYGSLGKKKCVEKCTYPEKYCKKHGTCVTAGMCL